MYVKIITLINALDYYYGAVCIGNFHRYRACLTACIYIILFYRISARFATVVNEGSIFLELISLPTVSAYSKAFGENKFFMVNTVDMVIDTLVLGTTLM